jgi:hypothetical protein
LLALNCTRLLLEAAVGEIKPPLVSNSLTAVLASKTCAPVVSGGRGHDSSRRADERVARYSHRRECTHYSSPIRVGSFDLPDADIAKRCARGMERDDLKSCCHVVSQWVASHQALAQQVTPRPSHHMRSLHCKIIAAEHIEQHNRAASAHADASHAQLILMHCAPFHCMHTQPPVVVSASDGGMPRAPRGPSSARRPDTNWSTIPLFAHFRAANFTSKDLALMDETLRSVTMQGTL